MSSSTPIKVVVFGATGQTGSEIVNGLIKSPTRFDITAVSRPSAVDKVKNVEFRKQGIKVVGAEITGPREKLVEIMTGADVVLSAIYFTTIKNQKILIDLCKELGVKRFIPSSFGPVMPPMGVQGLREDKEEIINYIKLRHVPYTIIDVAWWFQITPCRVPSGRTDYVNQPIDGSIPADGEVPVAFADVRSIGANVAKIIADPRTLNKYVYIYDEVFTYNQVNKLLEEVTGEKVEPGYMPVQEVEETIAKAKAKLAVDPADAMANMARSLAEYQLALGIRGDTAPEVARYLGYLEARDLYPDVERKTLRAWFEEVLAGKATPAFSGGSQ